MIQKTISNYFLYRVYTINRMTEENSKKLTEEIIYRYRIGDVIYKNKAHMEKKDVTKLFRLECTHIMIL